MPPDTRDRVVDFINHWSDRCEIAKSKLLDWTQISRSKFNEWCERYGKANEHNSLIPRDHWITEEEKASVIQFFMDTPLNGYRRLTYMMIDQDVAFMSPGTTYNILKAAGLMGTKNVRPSSKGKGFLQPEKAHQHWHIEFSYINISGTFYYLPIQKLEKIRPSRSSELNSPVISLRYCCVKRNSSANNSPALYSSNCTFPSKRCRSALSIASK